MTLLCVRKAEITLFGTHSFFMSLFISASPLPSLFDGAFELINKNDILCVVAVNDDYTR